MSLRRSFARAALFSLPLALVHCAPAPTGTAVTGTPDMAAGPDMAGPAPDVTFTMNVTVAAGAELHQCQFVKMPVGEHYVIGGQHTFTPGSHHLLLFRTDLAAIPTGGDQIQDCYEGSGGTIMSHVRGVIYGSQIPKDSMTLPTGVGFHTDSEEVFLLQVHYLNATTADIPASVDIGLFTTTDATSITARAGVLFYYDPFIDVPAGSMATASARCTLTSDITLVTVNPHYHSRGVGYQAFLDLPSQSPAATPFYTSSNWDHQSPFTGGPLQIKSGTAIRFYCNYDNTMGSKEYFQGQSASDNEMCMFTGMYYPEMDQSSDFCEVNMDMFGTGTTSCAETIACIQACTGPAPDFSAGMADVSPCWQKCFANSCPAATDPVYSELDCINNHCLADCTGADTSMCTTCVVNNCSKQVGACYAAACN